MQALTRAGHRHEAHQLAACATPGRAPGRAHGSRGGRVAAARGLTNKQAAAELGISTKTVGRHAESIGSKIGASTRATAALFAVEHDLLEP